MIENDSLKGVALFLNRNFRLFCSRTPLVFAPLSLSSSLGSISNYKPSTPHSRCQIGLVGNEEKTA